ncbi:MAG: nicotinate-nucleotide diphosphorylase (carboxylating) [Phycisphaerae bacterium]|nr:MAG: nicotinate-nucleotide diphosphorylase (carboxylating) [Phycisphaerae bacterium]
MSDRSLIPIDHDALITQTRTLVQMAKEEDLGRGDLTSGLLGDPGRGTFRLINKEPGVFAGRELAETIVAEYASEIALAWQPAGVDGAEFGDEHTPLVELSGQVNSILPLERVLLNFLQRLSGIATKTRRFVNAVKGTDAVILDTRKTTPGWRHLEKYAVRCGGGQNHRMGLHDAVLIKDNHLASQPTTQTSAVVFDMLNRIGSINPPPNFVEVEADTLDQVRQLFSVVGIDVILLDNFSLAHLREAVALRASLNLQDKIKLEASGGVNLDTVTDIAKTGVDYISVGALTHSATAVDLSLERIG